MNEELELEVVPFLDGPAAGKKGEIPIGYNEIWRFVRGAGYCLYRRDDERALVFEGTVYSDEQMADFLVAVNAEPILHADAPTPRARRVRLRKREPR